jgi:2',3'-cyclic-nucleotide 2'-phosphodiesterase
MRILFIGDVFGRPGRDLVRTGLPVLAERYDIDFTIANVENAAAGAGITRETGDELLRRGIDVMTTGNHVWDKREALTYIGAEARLLRPLNLSPAAPGRGAATFRSAAGRPIGVINAIGRVFMNPVDDPFAAVSAAVDRLRQECRIIIVDMHAEASAEKIAMGWHLDGRVTAVIGTHTHVQTADARVLPGGTAYLTDAGMTGPHDSIIGIAREPALSRFLTGLPVKMEPAEDNPRLQGAVITVDDQTGLATAIERVDLPADEIRLARAELARHEDDD